MVSNASSTDDKTFFTVMIESVEPVNSFIQIFWTYANHPGEAIQNVLSACSELEINNAHAAELDRADFDSLPDNVVHDTDFNVYYAQGRSYFPTDKTFRTPLGIIKAFREGDYDDDLIREGFYQERTDEELYEVEVVVENERLFTTFVELVKQFPSIKVFWIKLAADWEDAGKEEFWTNEQLNTVDLITDFLKLRWNDTVTNGHVALTAYSAIGQTNLAIDTHKTLKVLTKSVKIEREMSAAIRKLGFYELSKPRSLEYGQYHWHYRGPGSKSRTGLIEALKKAGFSLWMEREVPPEAWDEERRPPTTQ